MVFKVITEFMKENGKTNFNVTLKSEATCLCPNKESVRFVSCLPGKKLREIGIVIYILNSNSARIW